MSIMRIPITKIRKRHAGCERQIRRLNKTKVNGFTLVELMLSLVVMAIALFALLLSLYSSGRASMFSQERSRAINGAREIIEQLRDAPFSDVYRLYNSNPQDDPNGIGTAPGKYFEVKGLVPPSTYPAKKNAMVVFPESSSGSGAMGLREDYSDPKMGMPRDLNGDNIIDTNDHSADYEILPVKVVVEWQGVMGLQRIEYNTFIYRR